MLVISADDAMDDEEEEDEDVAAMKNKLLEHKIDECGPPSSLLSARLPEKLHSG